MAVETQLTSGIRHGRPAAFLDRDGVINIDHGYTVRVSEFHFVPGTLDACRALVQAGYALVVVTNQSGIGRGLYTEQDFHTLTHWMRTQFANAGAPLAGVYFCPHHPTQALPPYLCTCTCRKPAPGMLIQAAKELNLDLKRSLLFGDRASDLQAARAAGIAQRIALGTDGKSMPENFPDPELATARFSSLQHAVSTLLAQHDTPSATS